MQKKVGDVLYVLDLTPYTITEDTDVSIIYVQNEQIKGYKELNTELASKIHGFNQFIMTVLPRPWAGGGDEPEPEPELDLSLITFYVEEGSLPQIWDCEANDWAHLQSYWNPDYFYVNDHYDIQLVAGRQYELDQRNSTTEYGFTYEGSQESWPTEQGTMGIKWTQATEEQDQIAQWSRCTQLNNLTLNAYLAYSDQENNPHIWEYPTFVRTSYTYDYPDVTDVTYLYAAQSNGYPLDSNFTVTYTCDEPLVTFDSDGHPHVSADSTTGEYPVGNIPVTVTIHDNDGHYADKQLNYTLRLTEGFTIMIAPYDESSVDAGMELDLITGDNVYGQPVHCAIRFSYVRVPDGNGNIIPYPMKNEEYWSINEWPEGSEVTYWCDMNNTDIDLHITSDGGTDYDTEPIYHKDSDPHWFTVQLPNETINMAPYWITGVNDLTVRDNVASHNGLNMDEMGGRYYSVKIYPYAPASYTNEIKYGFDYEGLNQYGPSDFVFSITNGQSQSVQLTDNGGGSYSFSMNSNDTPDTFTITISEPS